MNAREAEILEAYRQLVKRVGPGFHPDTPFNGYEPPIDFVTEEQFEEILDGVFGIEGVDPYGVGLDVAHEAEYTRPEQDDRYQDGFTRHE